MSTPRISYTHVTYKDVELYVSFRYTEGRDAVMYHRDGHGSPAEDPEIEIIDVTHQGGDVYSLVEDKIEEIEELVFKTMEE
jgi:hypothetical protein